MAFVPRSFETIFADMSAYVRVQTDLTDFEIGSAVRTILEAAALEDDEQYFQMVQLLDAFSYQTAQGSDLDERVADFGITRLQPAASAGEVVIQDLNLVTDTLSFSVITGATSLILDDTSDFPTAGYPYAARIGEGTVQVEDILVSNNNTLTNTLTLFSAVVNGHNAGDRVSYVTGAADQLLAASIQVQVPSISGAAPIKFVTIETGTIVNGNFESAPVNARAVTPGSLSNVGVGLVTQFTSSPPFTGAGVINKTPFNGGRDIESDADLRDRARGQIQALTRGTVLALKQAALGVADPVTGQSVLTANVLEDFLAEEVILYVDDGTGFTPDTVELAQDVVFALTAPLSATLVVTDASEFPSTGFIIVSPESLAQIELLEYSAVNYLTNTLTLVGTTVNAHDAGDEVVLVDTVTLAAEAGTNFLQLQNFPIVRNSPQIWKNQGGGFLLLADGPDYFLNKGTGEIELVAGLGAGDQIVATYKYYTGLIKTVQTVIDGDENDSVNFPGVRAAGIVVLVETPVIRRINVQISITAQNGFTESDIAPSVREAIETYISSLKIGEDVIVAEIVQRTMEVVGVYNCTVITPAGDVIILENELPVPFSSAGDSLVTVT